jgi:hypothetical protein
MNLEKILVAVLLFVGGVLVGAHLNTIVKLDLNKDDQKIDVPSQPDNPVNPTPAPEPKRPWWPLNPKPKNPSCPNCPDCPDCRDGSNCPDCKR